MKNPYAIILTLLIFTLFNSSAWGQLINTIAGVGDNFYVSEGGLALDGQIGYPESVAVDAEGSFFFISESNQKVYKVDAQGIITTVAGSGTRGFNGDSIAAIKADLHDPSGIALDPSGNLYIADKFNHRIRKVNPSGIITTVAGTSSRGFSGDGGEATDAELFSPASIAIDAAGNLFIADVVNHRIRKVDPSGIITTVAGSGSEGYSGDNEAATEAMLSRPYSIAVDAAGNLFIADRNNLRIRKVDTSGIITTIAGTGSKGFSGDGEPAIAAQLGDPAGVAIDDSGALFIADRANQRIRKVDASGIITTIAGSSERGFSGDGGAATSAQFTGVVSVAADPSGRLFIADKFNQRIRKIDHEGIISTVAGSGKWGFSGDGGAATAGQLSHPAGIAFDGDGNLFIADQNNHRIRKVNVSGEITTVAGTGKPGFSGDGGLALQAELNWPSDVAIDGQGNIYIADQNNDRIRKVDASGMISTIAGTWSRDNRFGGDGEAASLAYLNKPIRLALDGAGNLYFSDKNNHRIRKIGVDGIINTVAGSGKAGYIGDGGAATEAQLQFPVGIIVDEAGNLYIADTGNDRIRKVDASGIITTVAGRGTWGYNGEDILATLAQFRRPLGVALDASGNLYITDTGNNRIRKVDSEGKISSIAGTGEKGYNGEGIEAVDAQLNSPSSVLLDNSGNLYFSDLVNNRIRAVAGYTVSFDQASLHFEEDPTAVSFSFKGAPMGATYEYTIISDGGSGQVAGSGSISKAREQAVNIDVSGLADGILTLSVMLTTKESIGGIEARTTIHKDMTAPLRLPEEKISKFRLYPNPADKGFLHIAVDPAPGFMEIRIFSLTGKLCYAQQLPGANTQKHKLDISNLTNGIYLVKVNGAFGEKNLKLLVYN